MAKRTRSSKKLRKRINRKITVMSVYECHRMGTTYAGFGFTRERLLDSLARMGHTDTGFTARRTLRAFDEQVARG